jgi:thioesterase domain-containing protein
VRQGHLVAIRRTGSRPPLFAVPGIEGGVLGYHDLARLLGDDQPFYGLESLGLDGSVAPLTE